MGEIEMLGGNRHKLTTKEWIELVKWAHQHVDGTINYGVPGAVMEEEPAPDADIRALPQTSASEIARFERCFFRNAIPMIMAG